MKEDTSDLDDDEDEETAQDIEVKENKEDSVFIWVPPVEKVKS